MADAWRQQDLAIEQAQDKHANYNVEVLQELYRKEYAGTQTGVTATRLANEGLRKVGFAITKSQREMMMAKDKSLLQKELLEMMLTVDVELLSKKTWRSPCSRFYTYTSSNGSYA